MQHFPSSLETAMPAGACQEAAGVRHELLAYGHAHPRREELEAYIRQIFACKHAARVRSFMPTLLALEDRTGRVCAVAGYRDASAGTLFLEQYLERPIEEAIGAASGARIEREHIVEVGNLASLSCRAACRLVASLPRYLNRRGREWIVFTATRSVRSILGGLRAPLYELAIAHADRIGASGEEWGSYYEADPRVMAGHLPQGLRLPAFAGHPSAGDRGATR